MIDDLLVSPVLSRGLCQPTNRSLGRDIILLALPVFPTCYGNKRDEFHCCRPATNPVFIVSVRRARMQHICNTLCPTY